ncbi:hypothetical protein SDC49_10880 [Lactobacillus sp. R2/2]|nr:hypothetical protein [Lactobacillus sp. R2/2]
MPVININEKIAALLLLLSRQNEVAVQNNNGKYLGFIDRQWLIKYLNNINSLK